MTETINYTESAIIGMWRMGASMEEMCAATGLYWEFIRKIINEYKKKLEGAK